MWRIINSEVFARTNGQQTFFSINRTNAYVYRNVCSTYNKRSIDFYISLLLRGSHVYACRRIGQSSANFLISRCGRICIQLNADQHVRCNGVRRCAPTVHRVTFNASFGSTRFAGRRRVVCSGNFRQWYVLSRRNVIPLQFIQTKRKMRACILHNNISSAKLASDAARLIVTRLIRFGLNGFEPTMTKRNWSVSHRRNYKSGLNFHLPRTEGFAADRVSMR